MKYCSSFLFFSFLTKNRFFFCSLFFSLKGPNNVTCGNSGAKIDIDGSQYSLDVVLPWSSIQNVIVMTDAQTSTRTKLLV